MTPLRERMIQDLRVRNYSPKTIDQYVRCVRQFSAYFGKSPAELTPEHIRGYQVHLVEERKASFEVLNQTVCALRFLYRVCLDREAIVDRIPYARRQKKLPVVLSQQEVSRLLEATATIEQRAIVSAFYGTGLRLSELQSVEIAHLDGDRKLLTVARAKGRKQRVVPLGERLLALLREHWRVRRSPKWLFCHGSLQNRPRWVTSKPATASSVSSTRFGDGPQVAARQRSADPLLR